MLPHCRSISAMSVIALLMAACGGDGDSSGGVSGREGGFGSGASFSILAALTEVPVSVTDVAGDTEQTDVVEVLVGDLAAGSAAAGVDRPERSADDGDLVDWARALTEGTVFIPFPSDLLSGDGIVNAEAYRDEVGFGVNEVESFVSWNALPESGVVWTGDLSVAATTEVADGVVSLGEGDDFEVDPSQRSAARSLGIPLRFARRDGLVVSTRSTAVALDWLDDDSERLADDPMFASAATALDDRDVLGAVMVRSDFSVPDGREAEIGQPFGLLSFGWAIESGEPVVTVVYSFESAEAASSASTEIEQVYSTSSLSNGRSVTETVTVEDVTVDGDQVIVTLAMVPADRPPSIVYQMLQRSEPMFVHA